MNNIEITRQEKELLENLLGLGSRHLAKQIIGAEGASTIGDIVKNLGIAMEREPDAEDGKLQAMLDKIAKARERYIKDKDIMDGLLIKLERAYLSPEGILDAEPQNQDNDTIRT